MKQCLFVLFFVALLGGLWTALPQVPRRATNESAPVILPDGDAVEEVINNRANGQPVITHTRIFEFGQVREVAGREEVMERNHASFDPAAEVLVVTGTFRGVAAVEDVRFVEGDGVLHVIRDLYPSADEAVLYSGRNQPLVLDSMGGDPGGVRPAITAAMTFSTRSLAPSTTPLVSSMGGVSNDSAGILNGRVSMSCGKTWNGTLVVNDQDNAYSWYISGANFGATPGTITLAGRSARILQWTPTQIIAAPTASYTWGPLSTLLTVRTAAGSTTSFGVSIAPAIRTRIYGQCTWYVAYARLNMGKQPSPYAYGGYSTITTQYVPQVGDQYEWKSAHTAIVTQVSGPVNAPGGYRTWTMQIGEYNAQCTNSFNSYTTQFQVRTTSSGSVVTKYPQSSIASYGSTTAYYR